MRLAIDPTISRLPVIVMTSASGICTITAGTFDVSTAHSSTWLTTNRPMSRISSAQSIRPITRECRQIHPLSSKLRSALPRAVR